MDVGLIVVDSILYGMMFARRSNLWAVWLAHLLGDILGLQEREASVNYPRTCTREG
jgi:hypothetical protein